jgi:hypothetical protein
MLAFKLIVMNRKIIYILLIFITGIFAGCKDYFDLTENPNQVSNPPINSLLATVTQKTGMNSYMVGDITSYFVQYLASPSPGGSTDTYQITDYTTTWDSLYRTMAVIYDMKNEALRQGATEHLGVADVLMAYHLSLVTDMFGDAPYTEAFTGVTLTPKYDSQEELYNETLRLLDEAIAELTKTDSNITLGASGDLIYAGAKDKWLRFAYALKVRQLNKISRKSSYNPGTVLEAVDNSFSNTSQNADDAQVRAFNPRNPWATIALENAQLLLGGWLSEQFMNTLNGISYGVLDPRISHITDPTVNNNYVGTPNGTGNIGPAANTVKDETYISVNSPLTSPTAPVVIASFAELKFIEAEAAFRLPDRERAFNAYRAGITANMNKLNVPVADRDIYLASSAVAQNSSALTLDLIFKEKYIATYLNPEAWNDARRYDYKYANFTLPANAALPTFIRRVDYPSGERGKNSINVPEVSSLADPLWWDQP